MAPEYVDFLNRSKGHSVPRARKLGRNSRGTVGESGYNSAALFRRTNGHAWSTGYVVAHRYRVAILAITAIAILATGAVQWYVSLR